VRPVQLQLASALRLMRYVLNGLLATGVHYLTLSVMIGPLGIRPVGLANLVAAITGTVASFVGNRRFVFKAVNAPVQKQAVHFAVLYAILAFIHSACMYLWCDILNRDYQIGFLLATGLQFLLSYIFNSRVVFGNPQPAPNPP
jgi:putative flippase GtrA